MLFPAAVRSIMGAQATFFLVFLWLTVVVPGTGLELITDLSNRDIFSLQGPVSHVAADFGPQYTGDEGVQGPLRFAGRQCEGLNDESDDVQGEEGEAEIKIFRNNLTGTIALVERGECHFVEKVLRAQDHGAIGVVVYNTADRLENERVRMGTDRFDLAEQVTIPAVFVGFDQYSYLRDLYLLAGSKLVIVKINGIGRVEAIDVDLSTAFLSSIMFLFRLLFFGWAIVALIYFVNYLKFRLARRKRLEIVRVLPTRIYVAATTGQELQGEVGASAEGSSSCSSCSAATSADGSFSELALGDAASTTGHATKKGRVRIPVTENEDQVEIELGNISSASVSGASAREANSSAGGSDTADTLSSSEDSNITDYFSSDSCVICLCNFEEGETITVLPCGHGYHKECIEPWLISKSALCPICKTSILASGDSRPLNEIDAAESLGDESMTNEGFRRALTFFAAFGLCILMLSMVET